ncbi:hypothetical protein F5882DRAFT_445589 [Hyaloscypha sp. PMI_1271]|nr:hypothetical protein F5882DRAFT_445589 [Hyaloscypha sp. PMI_1271]
MRFLCLAAIFCSVVSGSRQQAQHESFLTVAEPCLITPAPKVFVKDLRKKSNAQRCGGYFADNPAYHVDCGTSTCSSSPGGRSWGCCDSTSCYIPATCERSGAPDCSGTAASLCPYYPIMKCTYGLRSECITFIRQTADNDPAKVTSWGCGETPTAYIIIADVTNGSGGGAATPSSSNPSNPTTTTTHSTSTQTSTPKSDTLSTGQIAGIASSIGVLFFALLGFIINWTYQHLKHRREEAAARTAASLQNTNYQGNGNSILLGDVEHAVSRPGPLRQQQ